MRARWTACAAGLLVGLAAWAEWQPVSLPGQPVDLQVYDAGHVVFTVQGGASPGAYEQVFLPDGGSGGGTSRLASNVIGAFLDSNGCLGALDAFGQQLWTGGCGTTGPSGMDQPNRLRGTSAFTRYAVGVDNTTNPQVFYGTAGGGWAPIDDTAVPLSTLFTGNAGPLSAVRVGSVDYAVFGSELLPPFLVLIADAGIVRGVDYDVAQPRDVALFAHGAAPGAFVVPSDGGLEWTRDVTSADAGFAPASLPGGIADVVGVSFTREGGDSVAGGFGMATVRFDGGTSGVIRAVPHPSRPGELWTPSTRALPSGLAPVSLGKVACAGPTFCAILLPSTAANNVLLYWNNAPPALEPVPTLQVDDTQALAFTVDAGDPDGDPVYVAWGPADGGTYPVLVQSSDPDGRQVVFTPDAGAFCGTTSTSFDFTARVSDGLAAHTSSFPVTLVVNHVSNAATPALDRSQVDVLAGGPTEQVQATPGVGGCPPQGFVWREVTSAGVTFTADGGTATFAPPLNLCDADGGLGEYEVVALDGPDASTPARVSVRVRPWGPPLPPVFASPVKQVAGTDAVYRSLDAGHVCETAPQFPEVTIDWLFQAGAIPGVDVLANGSAVTPGSSFTAPEITVRSSDGCAEGSLAFSGRQRTVGDDAGFVSPSADLVVNLVKVLAPIEDAGYQLSGSYDPSSATYTGRADVDVNCIAERGLTAEIRLDRVDAGTEAQTVAAVGEPFSLSVPTGCAGGEFVVTAELLADGGSTGRVQTDSFTAPVVPVEVGPIDRSSLGAACGAGASGELSTSALGCTGARVSWERISGPALVEEQLAGESVTVRTVETELNALIGQTLRIRVQAEGGPGNVDSEEVGLTIVPEPRFVGVRHRSDTPIAPEGRVMGIAVELTNASDCGLTGVDFEEMLDGLAFVPGSARVGGQPVEAVAEGGVLRVSGIELPARATVVLTYSARPPLLGSPRPSGTAYLRGVPLSTENAGFGGGVRAGSGCGCSGSTGGLGSALALVALCVLRGRSKRRAP